MKQQKLDLILNNYLKKRKKLDENLAKQLKKLNKGI